MELKGAVDEMVDRCALELKRGRVKSWFFFVVGRLFKPPYVQVGELEWYCVKRGVKEEEGREG